MDKIDVNGKETAPVYDFLKNKVPGALGFTRIKWNFEKFLVDKEGHPVDRYWSVTSPESIAPKIEDLLNKK